MYRLLRSVCIFCRSSTTRLYRGSARALAGSWRGMHHYIRMQLSALAPSPSRPGHAGHHLISGLFRRGVCCSAMCRSRGPPPASSSPLGAYSSQASHRMTPHNLTGPLYLPLSTYLRVEDISDHHITCISHLRRSPNTLTLLQASICLRSSEKDE
jgi:hypothetical protein